jgi:hypothetical protein
MDDSLTFFRAFLGSWKCSSRWYYSYQLLIILKRKLSRWDRNRHRIDMELLRLIRWMWISKSFWNNGSCRENSSSGTVDQRIDWTTSRVKRKSINLISYSFPEDQKDTWTIRQTNHSIAGLFRDIASDRTFPRIHLQDDLLLDGTNQRRFRFKEREKEKWNSTKRWFVSLFSDERVIREEWRSFFRYFDEWWMLTWELINIRHVDWRRSEYRALRMHFLWEYALQSNARRRNDERDFFLNADSFSLLLEMRSTRVQDLFSSKSSARGLSSSISFFDVHTERERERE